MDEFIIECRRQIDQIRVLLENTDMRLKILELRFEELRNDFDSIDRG